MNKALPILLLSLFAVPALAQEADEVEPSDSTLQAAAGNAVGEGAQLDAEDRQTIRKLKVGSSTLGEGRLVAVTGFIVGKPHPNKGESVNCGLTAAADNDIHISIVGDPEESEFDSIVVEMIPQDRPEA